MKVKTESTREFQENNKGMGIGNEKKMGNVIRTHNVLAMCVRERRTEWKRLRLQIEFLSLSL